MSDLERIRGDTYADEFTLRDSTTKQPIDITDYSFYLTLSSEKNPADESSQIYQIAGTIVDAINGKVEFSPTEQQANQLGSFYYDIQMVDGIGRIRTIVKAKYKYTQDITKSYV